MMIRPHLLALLAASAVAAPRDDLLADIHAGFFDDILAGEPPMFAREITMASGSLPDLRDFIPSHRSVRGFKAGGSSKQHHTKKRSKDARKARAATRRSRA